MEVYLIGFLMAFLSIFFKAIAQQNVQYRRKLLILPTSYCLSACEMFTAAIFVDNFINADIWSSILLVSCIGTGGGLGCLISLDFHQWLTKKIYKWDKIQENT